MAALDRDVPASRLVSASGLADARQAAGKRRRWPADLKRQVVAALSEPGASVSLVARRYDVNANQLFKWRRQLAAPSPDAPVAQVSLLPVEIVAPPGPAPLAAPPAASAKPVSGSIEIALAGGIRVKIKGAVDPAAVSAAVGAVMAARRRR